MSSTIALCSRSRSGAAIETAVSISHHLPNNNEPSCPQEDLENKITATLRDLNVSFGGITGDQSHPLRPQGFNEVAHIDHAY
jgi:hypothetical protein